ncbi:MAG TPA: CPBP family intramembrane glutamic endopeptidase [Tepidisphaeraceae bacterium]|nr:CPBP family intramembrane glutamic endopeptidase [Tepidisphaeraceae bacterium]
MSIIGLIGVLGLSLEVWIGLLSLAATVIAIGIFIETRAYRPGSICGPQRLPPDEPLGPFVFIMIGGLSLWMLVPALTLKLLHRGVRLEDIKATHAETVILGILGGALPLFLMLLGTFTRRQHGLETLGFTSRDFKHALTPALAGTVFILPLVGWVAILADWLMRKYQIQHPMKHELLQIMDEAPSPMLKVMIAIGAVIVAPLFEEFLFRGHLQTLLARVLRRPWLAVIITSILFSLVHHWSIWLPIFALSICLGYMYERTGNLWVSVLMHGMFNGFSIVINLGSH